MTALPPDPGSPQPGGEPGRFDNGLLAASYVALTDVHAAQAPRLLAALGRARIAAYLAEAASDEGVLRLYVSSAERSDARGIVAAVLRAAGETGAEPTPDNPLAGIDTEAEFARLVADWHVDTHDAIRSAEKDLTREDEDWRARLRPTEAPTDSEWLDDDHYIPPVPPPLPRISVPAVLATLIILASVALLVLAGEFAVATRFTMLLGVSGVLLGTTILVLRMRGQSDDEDDDDGAIL